MRLLARITGALALLAFTGFCVFGFLASFEYPEAAERLPWQIGYSVLGVVGLLGVVQLVRRGVASPPGRKDSSR
jgi:hypothetical protein